MKEYTGSFTQTYKYTFEIKIQDSFTEERVKELFKEYIDGGFRIEMVSFREFLKHHSELITDKENTQLDDIDDFTTLTVCEDTINELIKG